MSSSDSDDEVAVRYGTPLDPYEEDEVPAKRRFQQSSEQHAVDAHGRRRFHGAFTGGFTAGHGNSVSTPEGWNPKAFKSSRADRGSFKNQAPEDFMDEEDRDEFGIAPRLIQTQDDFGGQKRPHPSKRFHDGPIPGEPVLEQFVRAVPETAAVRLLRAMGWRPGSGVGERVARERTAKTYGCYVPPEFRQSAEEADDSDGSDVDYEALFAPQDYEPYLVSRKDDQFGLGYSPLSRRSVLGGLSGEYGASDASVSHLKMRDKGKKVSIRGQAFGVGALEEEDEDVYAHQDMTHYDFAIGGASDVDANQQQHKKAKSEGLEGFVRSARVSAAPRGYPAPALPRDYTPAPAGFARTRFAPADAAPTHTSRGLGRHDLSAEARGAILGEPSVPPIVPNPPAAEQPADDPDEPTANVTSTPPKPIQRPGLHEMLYSKLLGRNVAFTPSDEEWGKKSDKEPIAVAASRDVDESSAEERVFRPFASDPAKQERYERFLKGGGTEEEGATGEQGGRGRLAEWEVERERKEFEQAAKLYRPLTGVLKDRFTSGGGGDDAAATQPAKLFGSADQLEAAKRGMYGALTRTVAQWRPDSLVCKRFNIPDPYSTRPDTKKTDKPKTSYSIFEYLEGSIHSKESFTKEQAQFSGSKSILTTTNPSNSIAIRKPALPVIQKPIETKTVVETPAKLQGNKRITVAELFLMEAEKERLNKLQNDNAGEMVTQTIDKFDKMELYNAIFMSDSEDEGVNDDNETKKLNKSDADFLETPENTERNTSPPRGIFANLDFDQLNSWSSKNKTVQKGKHEQTTKKKDINEESDGIEEVFVTSQGGIAIQSKDKSGERRKANDELTPITGKECNKERESTDDECELLVSATGGVAKKSQNVTPKKDNTGPMDIDKLFQSPEITENDLYGPKIPDNLKKKIETNATELEKAKMFGNTMVSKTAYKELDIEDVFLNRNESRAELPRPLFRDKNARQKKEKKIIVVESSSDSDSWVDINAVKSKKVKKKKNKKPKHKSKKNKKDKSK